MLNKKLFKKLNEQMEINSILNEEITEEEISEVENKLIFGEGTAELTRDLSVASSKENDKKDNPYRMDYYEDHKTEIDPENYKKENKQDK